MIRIPILAAILAFPQPALATCYDRCELDCLWEEYLEEAQESIDDGRRAEVYFNGAGNAYGTALDAAQAELNAIVDSVNPVALPSATDALPPLAQRVLGQFQTAVNLLNGLGNVQGGLVLERMGQIAVANANTSWQRALRALRRHKECAELAAVPVEPAPPPTPVSGPTLGGLTEDQLLGEIAKPKVHDRREGARQLATRSGLAVNTIRKIKQRLGVEGDTYVRFWLVRTLGRQGAAAGVALPQVVGHGSQDVPLIFESVRACSLIDNTSQACQGYYAAQAAHAEQAVRDLVAAHRITPESRSR